MRGFLILLLQCSISMSLVTLVYVVILPFLSKRYTAKWRYLIWLVIAAGWLFPFRPRINLTFLSVRMPDIPVTTVQANFNATPITYTGNIVNAPAIIPSWRVLTAIWILGVASIILYHALTHSRFMKIVRRWSEPVTDLKRLGILDNLKSELGIKIPVGLSVCQGITSPMLVGFLHPVILLPHIKITDDELPLILKHELIHLVQYDLWYKALILMATVLHWFNPVVYIMAKATAMQCEISCDALVLQDADFGQRRQYGEAIIGVVRNGAVLQTALSTNFYGGKKDMKNRISSIMDIKQKKAGVAVLCMVLVGIAMTGATLAATIDKTSIDAGQVRNNEKDTSGIERQVSDGLDQDASNSKEFTYENVNRVIAEVTSHYRAADFDSANYSEDELEKEKSIENEKDNIIIPEEILQYQRMGQAILKKTADYFSVSVDEVTNLLSESTRK